jgi:hypothetical protein
MYSLFLIPYTLWRLGGGGSDEAEVRTWRLRRLCACRTSAQGKRNAERIDPSLHLPSICLPQRVKTWHSKKGGDKKGESWAKRLRATFTGRLMLAWLAWALLIW